MRKATLLAAAAIIGGLGLSAQADISVTSTRTTITTGANALFDVIRFYAKISAGGTEVQQGATGLNSAAITMSSTAQFKFGFVDRTGDGLPDWDPIRISPVAGTASNSPLTDNATVNTIIAIRPYDAVAASQGGSITIPTGLYSLYPTPNVGDGKAAPQDSVDNDGSGDVTPGDFDPRHLYQSPLVAGFTDSPGLKTFRIEMFNSAVDPAALPGNANYARGAMFAVAVVPKGAAVTIVGNLAADKGPQTQVSLTDGGVAPEPATFGLLGIGAMGFLGRRNRKAVKA